MSAPGEPNGTADDATPNGPEGALPEELFAKGTEWLRGSGDSADVVLSSRARVASRLRRSRTP